MDTSADLSRADIQWLEGRLLIITVEVICDLFAMTAVITIWPLYPSSRCDGGLLDEGEASSRDVPPLPARSLPSLQSGAKVCM